MMTDTPPRTGSAANLLSKPTETAWRKCISMVNYARKNSPRVHMLLSKIDDMGCKLAPEPIVCEDVFGDAKVAGAFDPDRNMVVMNPKVPPAFLNQPEWTRSVTHELIHAYDNCRARVDPDDCKHIACTEIRAANLSGDCDFFTEFQRMPTKLLVGGIAGHQKKCVRRRAELSLSFHPQCTDTGPDAVRNYVSNVWEPCYKDVAPFTTN